MTAGPEIFFIMGVFIGALGAVGIIGMWIDYVRGRA